jgi:hypothetical protein
MHSTRPKIYRKQVQNVQRQGDAHVISAMLRPMDLQAYIILEPRSFSKRRKKAMLVAEGAGTQVRR